MSANARTRSSPVRSRSERIRPDSESMSEAMAEAHNWTGQELLEALSSGAGQDVHGWWVSQDGTEIWLTNPYGLDCGFYDVSVEGCDSILQRIRKDTHEREWGTL